MRRDLKVLNSFDLIIITRMCGREVRRNGPLRMRLPALSVDPHFLQVQVSAAKQAFSEEETG